MKKVVFTLLTFLIIEAHQVNGQIKEDKVSILSTGFGYTKNGFNSKGDFGGFFWSSEFQTSLKKRWILVFGAAATIHEGSDKILYEDGNGNWQDGEIRHMTGGIQSGVELGYNLLSSKSHLLQIGLGPVFRYQITTFPNYGWVNFYPDIYFRDKRYQRSAGVGGSGFISYTYIFQNQWVVQVQASLQYVSANDNLNMFGLSVGKVLSCN